MIITVLHHQFERELKATRKGHASNWKEEREGGI